MKTITYIINLVVLVVFSLAFAANNANLADKEMFISIEDAQANMPDKEIYIPQDTPVTRSAPNWEDNPAGYEFSATISGAVILDMDGSQLGDDGDMFGAFDADGNVRGIGLMLSPPFGPYAGTPVFEMQVRSNAAGDIITFKYYDASADEILDIEDSYEFVVNDIIGSVTDPWLMNVGVSYPTAPECADNDAGVAPFDCTLSLIHISEPTRPY